MLLLQNRIREESHLWKYILNCLLYLSLSFNLGLNRTPHRSKNTCWTVFTATVLKGAFLYQVKTDPVTHFHLFFHTSIVWIILLHEKWMPPLTLLFVLPDDKQELLNPGENAHKIQISPAAELGQSDRVTKLALKWDEKVLLFHTETHRNVSCSPA